MSLLDGLQEYWNRPAFVVHVPSAFTGALIVSVPPTVVEQLLCLDSPKIVSKTARRMPHRNAPQVAEWVLAKAKYFRTTRYSAWLNARSSRSHRHLIAISSPTGIKGRAVNAPLQITPNPAIWALRIADLKRLSKAR
ncbi:hypothetical protein [Paraburkholderia sp. DHOC27]|uniref:hypothetical protein n=1 Tax=Paraburkholderia sp. DHOC27 TaxID=2303330 RepID=UPI0011C181FA|nr:hypothetical protein [Paraburkholderia sp. DHOC27]